MNLRCKTLVLGVVAVVAAGGFLVGAAPASAHTSQDGWLYGGSFYERPTKYHDTWDFTEQCGDLSLSVTGRAWGVYSTRNVVGSHGQAFLARQSGTWREKWTNTETGESFFVGGRTVFEERKAKRIPKYRVPDELIPPEGLVGPIYLFRSTEYGVFFRVTDSHGRVYGVDKGLIVSDLLFDTLGDHAPGGTPLDYRIVRQVGHFPLFDADICDIADDLVGGAAS